MTKEFIDEREFELINIIGQHLGSNQRDLSRQLELSLGQTNMLIRRLVSKGLIRIFQLNKKKVQYLLTPKGLSEKLQKSIKYTRHTINAIGLIKDHLKQIILDVYLQGHRTFYIYSAPDLTLLIESAFRESNLQDASLTVLKDIPADPLDGFLLIGKEHVKLGAFNKNNSVNLVEEVAKQNNFSKAEPVSLRENKGE